MKKRHSVQLSPGKREDKVLDDKGAISKKPVPLQLYRFKCMSFRALTYKLIIVIMIVPGL